ncbi:UNVERIFIED_CONTAM: dockerin type I repeat protein [Acetivibrio alkalicellulosi]
MKRISCLMITFSVICTFICFSNYTKFINVHAYNSPDFIMYGDLTGDGQINSSDVILLKRYLLSIIPNLPSQQSIYAADLNADGKIDSTDYALLRRYVLGIMDVFPAENITVPPSPISLTNYEQEFLTNINNLRQSLGVSPLILDSELAQVARFHANDMVANSYLSPNSPTYGSFSKMLTKFNIRYLSHATVLIVESSNVNYGFNLLCNSQSHYNQMISPIYTHIGIGVENGPSPFITVSAILVNKH